MNSQLQIQQNTQYQALTKEYLEQAVYLTYHSFKEQNPLWNKVPSTYEEMREPMAARISVAMAKKTCFIALKEDKVICCITLIDLVDYKKHRVQEASKVQPKLLAFLTNIQENHIKAIDSEVNEKECLYGVYGGVDPKYRNSMVFFELWGFLQHELKRQGYKRMYGFITNPRMFQISKPYLNNQSYTEITVETKQYPQLNGYKIYFVKWEFTLILPNPSL